jgi:hypothetical protein
MGSPACNPQAAWDSYTNMGRVTLPVPRLLIFLKQRTIIPNLVLIIVVPFSCVDITRIPEDI